MSLKLNVSEISYNPKPIQYTGPDNDKYYHITRDIECSIHLYRKGELVYSLLTGFKTDFRSGPKIVDLIAPKIGKSDIAISWAIHDANYQGYLSKNVADILLYQMLLKANLEEWRCEAVYIGVDLLGDPYYRNDRNNPHVHFLWLNHEDSLSTESYDSMFKASVELEENLIFNDKNKDIVLKTLLNSAKQTNEKLTQEQIKMYYDKK